jgi:hypothetical protein
MKCPVCGESAEHVWDDNKGCEHCTAEDPFPKPAPEQTLEPLTEEERKERKAWLEAQIDRMESGFLVVAALRWLAREAAKSEPQKAQECLQIIQQKLSDLAASRMVARKALLNYELSPVDSVRLALEALGVTVVDEKDMS